MVKSLKIVSMVKYNNSCEKKHLVRYTTIVRMVKSVTIVSMVKYITIVCEWLSMFEYVTIILFLHKKALLLQIYPYKLDCPFSSRHTSPKWWRDVGRDVLARDVVTQGISAEFRNFRLKNYTILLYHTDTVAYARTK